MSDITSKGLAPFFHVCIYRLQTILQTEYVAILGVLKAALYEDYTYIPVKHYFIYNQPTQSTHYLAKRVLGQLVLTVYLHTTLHIPNSESPLVTTVNVKAI